MIRIGLIGDFSKNVRAHEAIPRALELISDGREFETVWVSTVVLKDADLVNLFQYDGLWCVPGSPYQSMEGALRAIEFARGKAIPFLGTCGGFQHVILEYFRNVLNLQDADHAECNPEAREPVIRPMSCSLVGKTDTIYFEPASHVSRTYGSREAIEEFHCSYGFNPDYYSRLNGSQGALHITGWDSHKEARVVEMDEHPFFMATLYQPELSALQGRWSPVVRAFFQAASFRNAGRRAMAGS